MLPYKPMFSVGLGNMTMDFVFRHYPQERAVLAEKEVIEAPGTDCLVYVYPKGQPDQFNLTVGQSVLKGTDQFNRAEGRKYSFTSALRRMGISKETRTTLWLNFWIVEGVQRY